MERVHIWASALVAIGLVLLGCATPVSENVVLIVVDTLRADRLGVYGYDRATSPNIDAWAARGTVFDRALASSPWTLPTFGSILTARLPSSHGAGWRLEGSKDRYVRSGLNDETVTLPEILNRAGFRTAALVGNPFVDERFGLGRGFEEYRYDAKRSAEQVVTAALRWLEDNENAGRFFLMLHFMEPHWPYEAPEPFWGRFGGEERQRLPSLKNQRKNVSLSDSQRRYLSDRYDETIAFLDHELGRLWAALEEREDTLVILTADHGEELFDHGGFEHGHTMMQELLRVPLVMVGPGVESQRVGEPVSLLDIAPTVLDATGVQSELAPTGDDAARSLWPDPLARRSPARRRTAWAERTLFAETMLYGPEQKTVLSWPYKLILHRKTGRRQLFDLASDPGEHRDLAVEHSRLADRLEAVLRRQLAPGAGNRGESKPPSDNTMRELEALGYTN